MAIRLTRNQIQVLKELAAEVSTDNLLLALNSPQLIKAQYVAK